MQNVTRTIKQEGHNMNNTILASQGMMQRASMGSPDVIMARRVMENYIGAQESCVRKEENGIHRLYT